VRRAFALGAAAYATIGPRTDGPVGLLQSRTRAVIVRLVTNWGSHVHRSFRYVAAVAAIVCSGLLAGSALAREPLPADVQLEGLVSERPVRDAIIEDSARAIPARVETFTDSHGHAIRIGTDMPTLDLAWYAGILEQTMHGSEISAVLVEVVPWSSIGTACGVGAIGCYFPAQGRIVVTDYDPHGVEELAHTIVHEYGHHVDLQLENLGHLVSACVGRDGSRSWWWVRVPDRFTCNSRNWELLIGELFAEDYVTLHGIVGWQLTTIGPPSASAQSRIVYDFETRFAPRTLTRTGFVRRHRLRTWAFSVKHWTWLTATLRGPNRSDLDLFLFRRGARKPLKASERLGSSERITYALRPGTYEVGVWAARAGGQATVRVRLD
jgi:hypothetical protein